MRAFLLYSNSKEKNKNGRTCLAYHPLRHSQYNRKNCYCKLRKKSIQWIIKYIANTQPHIHT